MEETQTQIAFKTVRGWIMSGQLPSGSLINERQLAERLGLSRTPVREALGRLEGEGHLRKQGRAIIISEIRVEEVMEVLALRIILETEAARLAAGHIASEKVKALTQAVKGLTTPHKTTPVKHWSIDDLLHLSIADASGNALLRKTIGDLRDRTRIFGIDRIPNRFNPGKSEHLAILSALERADADAAASAMRTHLENVRDGILGSLSGARV